MFKSQNPLYTIYDEANFYLFALLIPLVILIATVEFKILTICNIRKEHSKFHPSYKYRES